MVKKILTIVFMIISGSVITLAGTANIDSGQNPDTIYYSDTAVPTKEIDFKSEFDVKTMVFQFDLKYNTGVFIFDSSSVDPGGFLTNLHNPASDTFFFLVFDDTGGGTVTITGCRLAEDENYKGLDALQTLVSSIKFGFKKGVDTPAVNSEKILMTNFKFAAPDGDTVYSSANTIDFELFQRMVFGMFDEDDDVDDADFVIFMQHYNVLSGDPKYNSLYDADNDGDCDIDDYLEFMENYKK